MRKNILELQHIDKLTDLGEKIKNEKIKNEEKIISYYWKQYNLMLIMGISGIYIMASNSIVKKSSDFLEL